MSSSSSREAEAAEVWRLLIAAAMAQFGRTGEILQEFGLTPGHMKALFQLDAAAARPMGALAQTMGCDASTMTWLVDRLEERGLAERRALAEDRRVKAVALTAEGKRLKSRLQRRLHRPPRELAALNGATLRELREVLTAVAKGS